MSIDQNRLLKEVNKKFAILPMDVQIQLRQRLEEELVYIADHKLYNLLKRKPNEDAERYSLEEVIAHPELSIVGYLVGSLYKDPGNHSFDIIQFDSEVEYLRAVKLRTLTEKQITELILSECFGDPALVMGIYSPKTAHTFDYDKERAIRFNTLRTITTEQASSTIRSHVSSYYDYLDPINLNEGMTVVGQVVAPMTKGTIKSTRKEYGRLTLIPIESDGYENPKYDIIIWPEAFINVKNSVFDKGDLLIVSGKRAYNEHKKSPQIAMSRGDWIKKLILNNGQWESVAV